MNIVDLSELALKKVKISGNVIGKFGEFEIEQVYKNNTKSVLEVEYTFPIVETATVVGFEINVGDKVLKGKCKEKSEAKKEYQENIVKGNSSYLMEQENDNVFKISVGKLDKNEEVKIKIKYIDKFEITDNTIQILIPTLVTPKYNSNITNKLIYDNVDYKVDFNINIDKALNRKTISCPSHSINVIDEDKSERIEVLNYDLSKDFKLQIELKNELSSNAIISKSKDNNDVIYLSFMPEIVTSYEDSEKEFIFIIDVSGSMMGEKLEETKRAVIECLKQLDNGDRFNIIPFESSFESMNLMSIEYNEENMKKAIDYINNLKPLGGTEILAPLKFAMYEKDTEKIIMLFTDGQVGNENEILNYVENNINKSRIFSFGIDTNVNSYFIKQLAKVGNGKAELIHPNEKIDDKIIRTFARIQTPLLEDIAIDYGKNRVIDEIKEEKCLFNYEFFNVFVKIEKLLDDIILKGRILGKEYSWKISKEQINNANVNLDILFAKQEIDRLEEYINNTSDNEKRENYKKMIIELSEKYSINSKYTSFITVYERNNKLLEVPKYQKTTLSNKFLNGAILGKGINKFRCMAKPMDISFNDDTCEVEKAVFSKKRKRYLPSMFDNENVKYVNNEPIEHEKTEEEILEEKVNEYYKEFISQNKKSVSTFLLYSLYYLDRNAESFDYNRFLEFLRNNKDELLKNEQYIKLVYYCYILFDKNRTFGKEEIIDIMGELFKKIVVTNLKINLKLNMLSGLEVKEIIDNNRIIERIDDVIWYLYCYSGLDYKEIFGF